MTATNDRLARAGDFVLGLMDADARRQAERDLETDPAFRDAVRALTERMQALDDTAAQTAIPAGLWEKIETAISGVEQQSARPPHAVSNVVPFTPKPSIYLRAVAIAASLVVAFGAGYVSRLVTTPAAKPVVLVVLQTPANEPGAVFEAYADNSVRIVPLEDFAVPDGKIMQVWTLYDKAVGPVSLGTMTKAEIVTLGAAAFPRPAADQLYEITLEPSPGSPTGKPTGPILVKGFAKTPSS
ncbi:MAG TPA: anti-sigma factor [Rhizobiaceae bacterium]|nr:anti-sigma factor [Rhizobiaceae bacterium]